MQRSVPITSIVIDPANSDQVHHWARDMQVSPFELLAGIAFVGPRLSDLRRHFGKSAHIIVLENRGRRGVISPYGLPA